MNWTEFYKQVRPHLSIIPVMSGAISALDAGALETLVAPGEHARRFDPFATWEADGALALVRQELVFGAGRDERPMGITLYGDVQSVWEGWAWVVDLMVDRIKRALVGQYIPDGATEQMIRAVEETHEAVMCLDDASVERRHYSNHECFAILSRFGLVAQAKAALTLRRASGRLDAPWCGQ